MKDRVNCDYTWQTSESGQYVAHHCHKAPGHGSEWHDCGCDAVTKAGKPDAHQAELFGVPLEWSHRPIASEPTGGFPLEISTYDRWPYIDGHRLRGLTPKDAVAEDGTLFHRGVGTRPGWVASEGVVVGTDWHRKIEEVRRVLAEDGIEPYHLL